MPDTISNKQTKSGDTPPTVDDQTANRVITDVSDVAIMPKTDNVVPPEQNPSIATSFAMSPTKQTTMTGVNSPANPYIKTPPAISPPRGTEPPTVAAAS